MNIEKFQKFKKTYLINFFKQKYCVFCILYLSLQRLNGESRLTVAPLSKRCLFFCLFGFYQCVQY
jgi:hypothetical protein